MFNPQNKTQVVDFVSVIVKSALPSIVNSVSSLRPRAFGSYIKEDQVQIQKLKSWTAMLHQFESPICANLFRYIGP